MASTPSGSTAMAFPSSTRIKAANESLSKALQKNPGLAKDLGLSADDVAALPKSYQAPTGYWGGGYP
jgi:hypothetical protein